MKSREVLKGIIKGNPYFFSFFFLFHIISPVINGVVIVSCTSHLLTMVIYKEDSARFHRALILFAIISLITVLINFLNKVLLFYRTKLTACEIEDIAYQFYFDRDNWNEIKKEEAQAYITRTIIELNNLYFNTISQVITLTVSFITSSIYAISKNWIACFVILFLILIMFLLLRGNLDKLPAIRQRITEDNNGLYINLWDSVDNLEIEPFLKEESYFKNFNKNIQALVSDRIQFNRISMRVDFMKRFGTIGSILFMILAGIIISMTKAVDLGNILALVLIVPILSNSIFSIPEISMSYKNIQGIMGFVDRFFQSKNEKREYILQDRIKNIEIQNMNFSYFEGLENEKRILESISLSLTPAKWITIMGKNGAGKTTLLRIFAGLNCISDGTFFVNSMDINKIERESLWKQIYYFEQKPKIIPDTLKRNIILNEEWEEERFKKALEDSELTYLIEEYPDREEELINQSKLSEGEMQKIGFARIFYHDYSVLLLDEITSKLSPNAEQTLMQHLKEYIIKRKIIAVSISHKKQLNAYSDDIYYLEKGRLVKEGNY